MFSIAATSTATALAPPRTDTNLSDAFHARINDAPHLSATERSSARTLIDALFETGHVAVHDSDTERRKAVAGVQWAMESILRGAEFIITPQRATPFRTCGDQPEAQRVRKDALIERLQRDDPLHLVFCRDGGGTESQVRAYTEEIFSRHASSGDAWSPGLHEHVLPFDQDAFPGELSGAFILSSNTPLAFAIRALQADKASGGARIDLFLAEAMPPGPSRSSLGAESSLQDMLANWSDALMDWLQLDVSALAGAVKPRASDA